MNFLEILKMLASALGGGGLAWLFHTRGRWRKYGGADFDLVSRTVTQTIADLQELSERIGVLEKEKVLILNHISELRRENQILKEENHQLRKENEHIEKVLRAYMKEKNPNLTK